MPGPHKRPLTPPAAHMRPVVFRVRETVPIQLRTNAGPGMDATARCRFRACLSNPHGLRGSPEASKRSHVRLHAAHAAYSCTHVQATPRKYRRNPLLLHSVRTSLPCYHLHDSFVSIAVPAGAVSSSSARIVWLICQVLLSRFCSRPGRCFGPSPAPGGRRRFCFPSGALRVPVPPEGLALKRTCAKAKSPGNASACLGSGGRSLRAPPERRQKRRKL